MAPQLRPGTALTPELRLLHVLRRGAMGEVWVADSERWGRVAVKFLSTGQLHAPGAIQRFEREWVIASKLDSPHLVRMLDQGRFEGARPYIVMELLDGETLQDLINRVGALPRADAITLLLQIANALDAAHAAGIVHRDVKPENILLARAGGVTVVKVLDFGLAKPLVGAESLTATGVVMGTPYYMSPEQVVGAGKDVDHRSDLWALGAMAYRLLTGVYPFDAETLHALVFEIIGGSHKPLVGTGGLEVLEPWFLRAFQKDRAKRFDSAGEMVAELAGLLGTVNAGSSTVRGNTGRTVLMDPEPEPPITLVAHDLGSTQRLDPPSEEHLRGALTTSTLTDPFIASPLAPSSVGADSITNVRRGSVPSGAGEPSWSLASQPAIPAAPSLSASAPALVTASPPPSAPHAAPHHHAPHMVATPDPGATGAKRGVAARAAAQGTRGNWWPLPATALALLLCGAGLWWLVAERGRSAENESPAPTTVASTSSRPAPTASTDVAMPLEELGEAATAASAAGAPSVASSSSATPPGEGAAALTVKCAPPCIVLVDGKRIGVSPVIDLPVDPGRHRITAYRDDVGAKTMRIEVAAGESVSHTFSMRR